MAKYKLADGGVERDDGAFIPEDPANRDWEAYQTWLSEGNTPEPAETVVEAKARMWGEIKSKRDKVKAGGVKVGAKWFHTDDASRIQHMALNMMGANIPANLQWKTMDGSFVVMTQALAGQIFQAVAVLDTQAFAKAEEHRIAMEASNDPASYDFSAGWPASFEG